MAIPTSHKGSCRDLSSDVQGVPIRRSLHYLETRAFPKPGRCPRLDVKTARGTEEETYRAYTARY